MDDEKMQEQLFAPYGVEKILGIYLGKDRQRYYRVKWRDTWEPESSLKETCKELLGKKWIG